MIFEKYYAHDICLTNFNKQKSNKDFTNQLKGNKNILMLEQDTNELNLSNKGKFNLITGSWVIGFIHIKDKVTEFFDNIYDHLNDNGILIIKENIIMSKTKMGSLGYKTWNSNDFLSIVEKSKFKRF